ncbi:MAG: metallophosphatase family protein [Bacteroidia bacterium]|nr:metallophosphatase family protein [Bacteroidia bacterium]
MAELFVTGDKHGEIEIRDLSSNLFPAGNVLTSEDFVVILGDFGLLWNNPPSDAERYWLNWLSGKKWTTLVVDGNHENFDLFDTLPEVERWGAPVGVIAPDVYHLRRGYVYTIAGKRVFVFGGGESIDKAGRTPGISWWPREQPSYIETGRGLESLDRAGWKVDYVWTHAAPRRALQHLMENHYALAHFQREKIEDPVSRYLDEIAGRLEFSLWCFGHYHVQSRPFSANASGLFRAEYRAVSPLLVSERMEKALAENDFKQWNIDCGTMSEEDGTGPGNPVGGW